MRSMSIRQMLGVLTLLLICISAILYYWYNHSFSTQENEMKGRDVSGLKGNLLIARDSSPFKDAVVTQVLTRYDSFPVTVKVIDTKVLANTNIVDYDAILIIHRWEAGAPSEQVQSFMDRNSEGNDKIVVMTTSWKGNEKMENINAITGASIEKDAPLIVDEIITKLDLLLRKA